MNRIILLVCTVFALFSCDLLNPDVKTDDQTIKLRAGLEKRVVQDNDFAFGLLKKTMEFSKDENVFISPLSVSVAFGMARYGAAGSTKAGIETALGMSGLSDDDLNEYYRVMQSTLPYVDSKTKLSIANSMWCREGFPVKQSFLDVNAANFNAYIKTMDFSAAWAKDTINNWCSKKTNGLIKTILEEPIPEEAMLYLVNAVYFKGLWAKKFDKDDTHEGTFKNEKNVYVPVNMMSMTDTFQYYADTKAQYLELPYGNKSFSMTIILPTGENTVSSVLEGLEAASLTSVYGKMHESKVMLQIPRFKVEAKYTLNDMLISMGMADAFSSSKADFSGISDIDLYISQVLHKTYITVDEDGTEAAAVTSIGFETTSMPDYPMFYVNKPFIYLIRERSTGVILFIGKMGNPAKY